MIRIQKIHSLFCLMQGSEILEAFDTRYEADAAYEPYRLKMALENFDKRRSWTSLWDIENR